MQETSTKCSFKNAITWNISIFYALQEALKMSCHYTLRKKKSYKHSYVTGDFLYNPALPVDNRKQNMLKNKNFDNESIGVVAHLLVGDRYVFLS